MDHKAEHQYLSLEIQQCILRCHECHDLCVSTIQHCLQMGGKHAMPRHISLLMDCSQICHTAEDFMLRNSASHMRVCGVCAEICELCAQDCQRIDPNDTQMQACAEACRRCAESCYHMANQMPTPAEILANS
jgi:hypothetical protein